VKHLFKQKKNHRLSCWVAPVLRYLCSRPLPRRRRRRRSHKPLHQPRSQGTKDSFLWYETQLKKLWSHASTPRSSVAWCLINHSIFAFAHIFMIQRFKSRLSRCGYIWLYSWLLFLDTALLSGRETHSVSKAWSGFVFRWKRKSQKLRLAVCNAPAVYVLLFSQFRLKLEADLASDALWVFQSRERCVLSEIPVTTMTVPCLRSPPAKLSVSFRSSHNLIINRNLMHEMLQWA
jgi:hypothetical protein